MDFNTELTKRLLQGVIENTIDQLLQVELTEY